MSGAPVSPAQKLLRPVAALAALAVVLMLVMSYWGNYVSGSDTGDTGEDASVEASETVEPEESAQEGSAEGDDVAEPAPSPATVIVLIEGLNFRTAPSRDADLIRGLGKGDELTHLETSDGWYKVRDSDGNEGYVSASSQYTQLSE